MLILALHRLYKDELPESNWVPMYGLSLTIFIASVGLIPVPFIITIDVLPPKVCFLNSFSIKTQNSSIIKKYY